MMKPLLLFISITVLSDSAYAQQKNYLKDAFDRAVTDMSSCYHESVSLLANSDLPINEAATMTVDFCSAELIDMSEARCDLILSDKNGLSRIPFNDSKNPRALCADVFTESDSKGVYDEAQKQIIKIRYSSEE